MFLLAIHIIERMYSLAFYSQINIAGLCENCIPMLNAYLMDNSVTFLKGKLNMNLMVLQMVYIFLFQYLNNLSRLKVVYTDNVPI